jgi:hypothetical protein
VWTSGLDPAGARPDLPRTTTFCKKKALRSCVDVIDLGATT